MFFDNLRDAGLVLFLGEGNFSFSASVLRRSQEKNVSNIYTTCYEKENELNVDEASLKMERMVINEKHRKKLHKETISKTEKSNPIKNENIAFLRSVGCHVLQGVDAEVLDQDARLSNLWRWLSRGFLWERKSGIREPWLTQSHSSYMRTFQKHKCGSGGNIIISDSCGSFACLYRQL